MPASPAPREENDARTVRLTLEPMHGDPDEIGHSDGMRVWQAMTDDPSFNARVPAGAPPLRAGWYSARVRMDLKSGEIHAPQVYLPDAAGQYSEERSAQMAGRGGIYNANFLLPHPTDHIRFDPSRLPCEFTCEVLELTLVAPARPAQRAGSVLRRSGARLRSLFSRPLRMAQGAGLVTLSRSRKKRVLAGIDRNGVGLEIGPSHDPIAPKRDGFNVHVIDHASREELLVKYEQHNLALDRIEEVDFVWHGESYLELTKRPHYYDWIIASHLIEHTPDLIAFLVDCDSILKDNGVLSLVIPDKRFVFDRFRPITGLARVIDAHFGAQRIHSAGSVAEYFLNVASKSHQLGWTEGTRGEYGFIHEAQYARDMIREVREKGSYLDIHNWCFTPHSFRLIVNDLHLLGFINLREVEFHSTEGCEFYVTLGRHGAGPGMSRLDLLRAVDAEQAAVLD
ncbi:MAG TPA: class I SAM-dependent methyltransferase [Usitatibacter sp.]|nr:class I SAM-dependent methyltransferase [Usitatibacter sp.]